MKPFPAKLNTVAAKAACQSGILCRWFGMVVLSLSPAAFGETPACVPSPSGLVSWWRAEGNASDQVGGNNGMLIGDVSFVPGKVGLGFGLNGSNSFVQIPHHASLNLTNQFTLEFWYLDQGKTWWYSMITKRDGGFAPANFGIHAHPVMSYGLQLFFTDPTVGGDSTSDYLPVPSSGVFHHLAATFRQVDSSHVELQTFVDGQLVKTATVSGNLANTLTTAPILIGADYAAQDIFKGIIDEVSNYNRALSASEIQGIYAAGSAGKCAVETLSPVCWAATGHCYEFVRTNITWHDALHAAAARNYQGRSGHLATITSAAENEFLAANFSTGVAAEFGWIAGHEPGDDGVWRWAAGPESGAQFSFWASPTAPSDFANWGGVEPNDNKAGEDYAMFNLGLEFNGIANGRWADAIATPNFSDPVVGYLVEYEPAAPASNCVAAPSGLVSWWRGEGNAFDFQDSNHGALSGNATFGAGRVGQNFVFDGDGDAVSLGNPANLRLQNFTIEAWVKRASTSRATTDPVYVQGAILHYGAGGYGFAMLDDGRLYLTKVESGQVTSTLRVADTHFHHVAVTKSGSTVTFFVDGTTEVVAPFDPGFEFGSSVAIGARGSDLRHGFWGSIDDLSVFNRALSVAELQSIHAAGSAGKCAALPPTNNCVAAPSDMAGWWPAEGDANDAAGRNNGILMNGVGFAPGMVGQAFSFNGSNSYVQIPHHASLDLTNEFTIELWYKEQGSPQDFYGFVSKRGVDPAPCNFGMHGNPGGPYGLQIYFLDSAQGYFSVSDFTPLPAPAVFHHLAASYKQVDATHVEMKTFLNGQRVKTSVVSGNLARSLNTEAVTIGATKGTHGIQEFFKGLMDEIAIYRRALSDAEVLSLYNAAESGKCHAPPGIVTQSLSQRVTVGWNVTFTVVASGTPPLHYQWRFNGDDLAGATDSALSFTVNDASAGNYSVRITNAFGSIISSNALLVVNHPPVADASATLPLALSPNNTDAGVALDGSRSSDPDDDPLHYEWFAAGATEPFATGIVAVVTLPVGSHPFDLVVSDGLVASTNAVTVDVITAAQAAERLAAAATTNVSRAQPLLATLSAAIAAIDRSNPTAAVNQLRAFQNQVRAQVWPIDPELAERFIQAAQEIIDLLTGGTTTVVDAGKPRFKSLVREAGGKAKLKFAAATGRIYLVEASTDLVNWTTIGVAVDRGGGDFEFEDAAAARVGARFYRIVSP